MTAKNTPSVLFGLRQTTLEEGFFGAHRVRGHVETTSSLSTMEATATCINTSPTLEELSVCTEGRENHMVSLDEQGDANWRGEPLENLRISTGNLPPMTPSTDHKIFFKCSKGSPKFPLVPHPSNLVDKWSSGFVRLPCSPESLYPLYENGRKTIVSRWALIENCLRQRVTSTTELKEAILSYNSRFSNLWSFNVLHSICQQALLPDGDEQYFFNHTLPAMCALALNLPVFLTEPIPLMQRGRDWSFTFSQLQIASLLANAFFCTFPRRNSRSRTAEFANYPDINFCNLLSTSATDSNFSGSCRKIEKVRCLLHYFHRVTQRTPSGTVTYTRRCLGSRVPDWAESSRSFDQLRVHISAKSTIEDAGPNTLQIDFANQFLGGGVLRTGCVQEEIMFVLRPELLATCLFVERLGAEETVIVEGAETYSTSAGYADTFRWTGDFQESSSGTERDEWGRWRSVVAAMDATNFRFAKGQFRPERILRELNKAYCAFTDDLAPRRKLPPIVSTGNWGCGAFRGNLDLKGLIQMIACLQAGKSLVYSTFGDQAFCNRLYDIYQFLSSRKVTIGRLWNILTTLDESVHAEPSSFFDHLKSRLSCSSSLEQQDPLTPTE
ncbi:unnamed protein product [Dicrocoelium dendriticum]|nr:unnamed protein product [Dicrocoelium dendriticum]